MVFSFASLGEKWKVAIVSVPFLALLVDFGSRYLAKYYPNVVYLMLVSGALLGFSFAVMIVVPLYEMWLKRH